MKPFLLPFGFLLAVFFAGEVHSASNYRGGTISYKPTSPNSIDFAIRLSFRRSSVYCDQSRVVSRYPVYSVSRTVTRYNYWYYYGRSFGGSISLYCSNFSIQEDWSEVYGNFTFSGDYNDDSWNVRIHGGNWINGMTYSNPYNNMQLEARVNKTASGLYNNSSPVSNLPLTVYVVEGISSAIEIPVEDPDGDTVRCRYASYQECYRGMCTYFPHGALDEDNCTLSYNGGGSAGQHFPIILKLEDSSNSSVDLQFVVHVVNSTECSNYTVLNSPDREASYRGVRYKCDRYDLTPGWYRFMGDAGTTIATSCVEREQCGTNMPGWMQGSHPTHAEGIVTRRVCYHWYYSSGCCDWNNNIRVRNCGGFYVYELVKPPACNLRYCGIRSSTKNQCSSSPCGHNGTCITTFEGHWCYCPSGSTGRQCETNLYPCNSNPCLNGGTCNGGNGWYRCSCRYGFTGQQCQTYVNYCSSWPCRNGGTCNSNYYGYQCYCPHGYTGRQCETSTNNNCTSSPCRNNGTCATTYDGYRCYCPYGYTGRQCETHLYPCNSNPCRNGGTCNGGYGWYHCSCRYGYTGQQCQTYGTVRIQEEGPSGRLQVYHNGVWGTVCDDGWSMTNTHVVCRQLGFAGGRSYTNRGGGSGPIWLDNVQCSGS